MSENNELLISFSENDAQQRLVVIGEHQAGTLAELVASEARLRQPEFLGRYCDAANYLAEGDLYRTIHDPDAYRADYQQRFDAEDPSSPFQEGVPRLRDFGLCQIAEVAAPKLADGVVVFYVEDAFLRIPYRVTAPGPEHPDGEVVYEPLPMLPIE